MEKNKTGKPAFAAGRYFKYAIGEIILVVIGILIALWINTLNQEKAQQKKIDSILVKIQNDILQDIDNADWLLENFMRKDSIYTRVMRDTLSPEDIKAIPGGSYGLDFVTTWWMEYHIQTNGYNLLKENIDIVPKKYDELIKTLDEIYTFNRNTFETYNSNSEDIARQYKYYLNDNQPWLAVDGFNAKRSDAKIEFILNNPKFKNQMYAMLGSVDAMVWEFSHYKNEITEIYIKITELLGENARPLPKVIRLTSVANTKDAEDFVGIYQFSDGHRNILNSETIEVYLKDKDLYMKTTNYETGPFLQLHVEKPIFSKVYGYSRVRFIPERNSIKMYFGTFGITEWTKITSK
ncbi:hypothetical protein K8354_04415 [Polaribacter litorisediminis]|uniref:hypothetical protein n=1 Tax=Polaribacter litorisediminis TaxID=1908341 RepID=UPI001CBE1527|nr:hypothetical protein [Polaribacter litorisediminis]UAM99074.1 hypothetical protein K8354_04415 [Polaribacter litorisediminis]